MRTTPRLGAIPRPDAVLVQAAIAGSLSFAHLHDIAEAAGQHGWKAWAYPISVDLLLVAAWRRLRQLRESGGPTRAAWTWFTVALVASLGANVATAGLLNLHDVPALLRILVAGWPALAFLGGTLLAHSPHCFRAENMPAEPEPEREEVASVVRPESEPVPDAVPAAEPARSLPAGTQLPAALVEHARKIAAAHRAQTGEQIDADTLRARLNVPAPMAVQLATQLT